jgi:hypothetical protein
MNRRQKAFKIKEKKCNDDQGRSKIQRGPYLQSKKVRRVAKAIERRVEELEELRKRPENSEYELEQSALKALVINQERYDGKANPKNWI